MAKLLIADGSPTMHRIMELTFEPEQIQVIAASEGEQAVALLPIVKPDIVIADPALAGCSGYDVAAFVRQHPELAHIPVLLLAGTFEPIDQERAARSGVSGSVTKPFDPAQLVALVRELLAPPPPPRGEAVPVLDESSLSAEPSFSSVPSDDASPVADAGGSAVLDPDALAYQEPRSAAAAVSQVEPPAPGTPQPVERFVASSRGALDDYFERLDAALSRLDDEMGPAADLGRGRGAAEEPALPTIEGLLGDMRRGAAAAPEVSGPSTREDPASSARSAWEDEGGESGSSTPADGKRDAPPSAPRLEGHPVEGGAIGSTPRSASGADLRELMEALDGMRTPAPVPGRSETEPAGAPPVASPVPVPPPRDAQPASALEPAPAISDAMIEEITRRVIDRIAPGFVTAMVTDVVTRVAERVVREELTRARAERD
jgi:CheY-like chemotaxis protein